MQFGLIGAGGIGKVRAQALILTEGCRLSAVTDRDEKRAQALAAATGAQVLPDFRELLKMESLDAVIISTPPQFHEEIAIAAMEADKHVLCEKPLANSVEACRRMVETAHRTGRTLATGFNHRYFPAVQFVKQTLDSGAIGELDHIRAFAGHTGLSEFSAPWMHDKEVIGGGALLDNGIHIIDLTRYLLGDVEEVYGVATNRVWKLDRSEDNGIAILKSPQGKHAILQATWSEWKGYRFSIEAYGDRGMARASYAPMMSMSVTMDKPGGARRRQHDFYPANILREKIKGWQSTVIRGFRREYQDFVALCAGRRNIIADGFDGFRAVEIANAIYRCGEEKCAVRLTDPF